MIHMLCVTMALQCIVTPNVNKSITRKYIALNVFTIGLARIISSTAVF